MCGLSVVMIYVERIVCQVFMLYVCFGSMSSFCRLCTPAIRAFVLSVILCYFLLILMLAPDRGK